MLLDDIEIERSKIQQQIDRQKTQEERNKLGQFATPTKLAMEMLEHAQLLLPFNPQIRFLDPAIGTGSFYSALLRTFPGSQISEATGYEIDPAYGMAGRDVWKEHPLKLHIHDFTQIPSPNKDDQKFNLLLCNPPYVRHHHIQKLEKRRLQQRGEQETGIKLSEQAGLYGHFLLCCHNWMVDSGLAGWLIPGEFMSVNYGKQIREYLLTRVTLLHIHSFNANDVQFDDALVSSTIVWFKKVCPSDDATVKLTYGGTLLKPEIAKNISHHYLHNKTKWNGIFFEEDTGKCQTQVNIKTPKANILLTSGEEQLRIADFFDVKRGIATGGNKYFILNEEQIREYSISKEFLTPVLPNPRYLKINLIETDDCGDPVLDQKLYLLTCDLAEKEVESLYPTLWQYLQKGVAEEINKRYLCRSRRFWYIQEKRSDCTFLCAYMGRYSSTKDNPFRFILNLSRATATNAYHILYPKAVLKRILDDNPEMIKLVWQGLEALSVNFLIQEGRVYGGGMHKMEPNELANVPAESVFHLIERYLTDEQIIHIRKNKSRESKECYIQTLWETA